MYTQTQVKKILPTSHGCCGSARVGLESLASGPGAALINCGETL